MNKWLEKLNPRERLIVIAGGLGLLVMAVYLFAWEPLIEDVGNLKTSVKSQQELYEWMQKSSAEVASLRGAGTVSAGQGGSILSVVTATVKPVLKGAKVKGIAEDNKKRVKVDIDQVSFDDVIRWLGRLQQRNGVQIVRFYSEQSEQQGRVNIKLLLTGS